MGAHHGPELAVAGAICLLLAINQCAGQPANIQLIHPTLDRALIDDASRSFFEMGSVLMIKNDRNANPGKSAKFTDYKGNFETALDASASTNLYTNNATRMDVGQVKYNIEIDHLRNNITNFQSTRFDRKCNQQVFRAFDMVQTFRPTTDQPTHVAIGFTETSICVMWHFNVTNPRELFEQGRLLDNILVTFELDLPINRMRPAYRIASATIRDPQRIGQFSDPYLVVEYYDEAGYVYRFDLAKKNFLVGPKSFKGPESLTAVNLDGGKSLYTDADLETGLIAFVDPTLGQAPTMNGLDVMKRHFEHSFVESIAMLEGSLVFSQRMFNDGPVTRFINDKTGKWPRGLLKSSSQLSVQAIEAYKFNGHYYYHIFDINAKKFVEFDVLDRSTNYFWCKLNSTRDANEIDWPTNWRDTCRSYKSPHEVGMTPIDVVYRAQCNKVYAFYQHMYQVEEASKPFSKLSPFNVVEWMKFPVNAMLHHKDRLYLFGPANRLYITNKLEGCDFQSVQVASEHYQSDLLLLYQSEHHKFDYTHKLPFYDSGRHFNGSTWLPPLDERKEIAASYRLSDQDEPPVPGPVPTSGPTPGPTPGPGPWPTQTPMPTPKPFPVPERQGGSMLTIIIIAVIVFGIICGCIYYMYFISAPPAPPRKQKSIMRKDLIDPASQQRQLLQQQQQQQQQLLQKQLQQQQKQHQLQTLQPLNPTQSQDRSNQPPIGSALSPTMTVRSSGIHPATSVTKLTKSAKSTGSAKKISPTRSLTKSPTNSSAKSPKKSSVKSSAKSPVQSPKSKLSVKTSRKSARSPGNRRSPV